MSILTEYSSAWIFVALLLGFLYALMMYYKQRTPWGATWQKALAALRFVWVSGLALLLVGILMQQFVERYEKPSVVFAIDNSESLSLQVDSSTLQHTLASLQQTAQVLEEYGFEVEFRTLQTDSIFEQSDAIHFTATSTPLSSILKEIQNDFENRNLATVVLLSDGAYNRGLSPDISFYPFQIHTVGIGDTIAQKDVVLKSLFHNKVAYLGNTFPIVAELTHTGFENTEVNVVLSHNGKTLSSQKVRFSAANNELKSVEFLIQANAKGMQHYVVQVVPQKEEFTIQNNTAHAYVDVIDSKEKILLVAAHPHPDIKAFRLAIEKNENYQFDVYLPYLRPTKLEDNYDLIIFHQLPAKIGKPMEFLPMLRQKTKAELFVVGAATDYNILNSLQTGVFIRPMGNQMDNVLPSWNDSFTKFYLTDEQKNRFADYPPATVPFANYEVSPQAEIMVYQRIGNIQTKKPLIVLQEKDGRKTGTWIAENTWRWRLGEFAVNENHEGYDALLSKIIQYLSTKETKRRFVVSPTASQFATTENVTFDVEVYNSIYEPLVGATVRLELVDEKGNKQIYTFTNSTSPFRYSISALEEGVYSFKATTQLDGKTEISTGQFVVNEIKLESLHATADFNLLRRIAHQNKGNFYTLSTLTNLQDSLQKQKAIPTVFRSEERTDLINSWWLLFVLIGLASFEWSIRKYTGGY